MSEWRLFDGPVAHVSTAQFHAGRGRAPHLEQHNHRDRLIAASLAVQKMAPRTVVDLGCGDGGLLELLGYLGIVAWGYDFAPANADGWSERGVVAELYDVFGPRQVPSWGELVVLTEVLEHLSDPHGVLEWISRHAPMVVASSPKDETGSRHAEEHAWAWDLEGYRALFEPHWIVESHEPVGWSQLLSATSRHLPDPRAIHATRDARGPR